MVLDSMFEYQQGKERVPIGFSMVLEESYQPFCMKRESRLSKKLKYNLHAVGNTHFLSVQFDSFLQKSTPV